MGTYDKLFRAVVVGGISLASACNDSHDGTDSGLPREGPPPPEDAGTDIGFPREGIDAGPLDSGGPPIIGDAARDANDSGFPREGPDVGPPLFDAGRDSGFPVEGPPPAKE